METRLIDFTWIVLYVGLTLSGLALMTYAVWKIGQELMRAIHVLLTCWDYCRHPARRDVLLADPVARKILTMRGCFARVPVPGFAHARQLRRLQWFREQEAKRHTARLVWDRRLGALLTPEEYGFLYGKRE